MKNSQFLAIQGQITMVLAFLATWPGNVALAALAWIGFGLAIVAYVDEKRAGKT